MSTKTIWLYHINPNSPQGYGYSWDVDNPKTLLLKNDKEWGAKQMFNQIKPRDMICVYMKNIGANPDGVYVVGRVTRVDVGGRTFVWEADEIRSAAILSRPILKEEMRKFFARSHGHGMQSLLPAKQKKWLLRLGRGEVFDGVPVVKAKGIPRALAPNFDSGANRERGILGESHVIQLLAKRYSRADGFTVVHVSKSAPGADHDIAVMRKNKTVLIVEVKTRVGVPGDPVMISERELACRRNHPAAHQIFIVYLNKGSSVRSVLEIGSHNFYALAPRQHWLTPGFPGSAVTHPKNKN
ncbi:MAG: DUF3883 domain-containing protein [Undibacterium sp.]|nr:DUF3883 domain-containing protein [Opitutaceae bacterium]